MEANTRSVVGASAGFLTILALIFRSGFPGAPAVPASSSHNQPESPPHEASDRIGPWLATQRLFGHVANDSPSSFRIPPGFDVQIILATIPDPLHTRLGLFTDSSLQAIQKAAAVSEWDFASQWMPWTQGTTPHESEQPGILIFRHKARGGFDKQLLIIFIAGETPTAGINPAQFQLARSYSRVLAAPAPIRIQGPTFSGSFYSLANLINADRQAGDSYLIRSGTASSFQDAAAFKHSLRPQDSFCSANESTADQASHFRDTLHYLNIGVDHAAVLTEDESGFGRAIGESALKTTDVRSPFRCGGPNAKDESTDEGAIRVLRFPREIAHLRNAYKEAVGGKADSSLAPELNFSVKEGETGEDSVPTFSLTHSPLSQDAILNEITGFILRERIHIVEISATNVLDIIFLARVLRRECPDTRLLILNPDLLFVEAARTDPLTGILAISSYPLFSQSNLWMGPEQALSPVTHSDANSESIFNATILLLSRPRVFSNLTDYDLLRSGHPAGWLLTLDRDGFLPVHFWSQAPNLADHPPTPIQPPRTWSFLAILIATASTALSSWICLLWFHRTYRVDSRLSLDRGEPGDEWREVYILAIILLLGSIQVFCCAPEWNSNFYSQPAPVLIFSLAALAMDAVLALAIVRRYAADRQRYLRQFSTSLALIALAIVGAVLWAHFAAGSISLPGFRAVELRFGTSPVWPVLAACVALLVFAFVHVTRLYLFAYQEPRIVTENVYLALQPRLKDSVLEFNRAVGSPLGFCGPQHWWPPVIAIPSLLALACLFHLNVNLRTIEGLSYDILLLALYALVTTALLVTALQITFLWSFLQAFLASLGSLPLANSFIALHRAGGNRPIWVRSFNIQSLTAHVRAAVMLHDMALLYSEQRRTSFAGAVHEDCEEYRWLINQLVNPQKDGVHKTRADVRDQFLELRALSTRLVTWLFDEVIKPYWRSHQLAAGLEEKAAESLSRPRDAAELAETFAALHFSSFLVYAVRQVRNLMWSLPCGFALLVFSVDTSSMQSPRLISRLLVALFAVLAWVLWKCGSAMERNPILSHIAGTEPGQLNSRFYVKIAAYGAVPILGLLSSEFPSISSFLFSWVAPALQAFR